jgi:mannose-6-phosphate isomerase
VSETYPLIFDPVVKEKVWGGRNLERIFPKSLPESARVGELWEIADLPEGESIIANGPLAGKGLHDAVEVWGKDLLGEAETVDGRFPLLIKLLDAEQDLSVQVHPTEEAAARRGGSARVKHEAWYIIESRSGAIYRGLKPGVARDQFAASLADGTCPSLINRVPVKAGQCHYLPSGTLHALGAGVVLAEVQTPSDTTYRVYDWDRPGPDGKPRDLHVDEAMESIDFEDHAVGPQTASHVASAFATVSRICACEHFLIEKVRFIEGVEQALPYHHVVIWIVLEGRGTVSYKGPGKEVEFSAGRTLLLPAGLEMGTLKTTMDCSWLEVTVPTGTDF